jgi:ribosomal protein L11 methyltransferase
MRYTELKIEVKRNVSETVQAALLEAGFDSMQIDDPMDAVDIAEHQDLYKYDYINEEITRAAEEAESGSDTIVITLYFADDEEGKRGLNEAEALLKSLKAGANDIAYETNITGDDSEWLYKWQEFFKPTKVGERIVVKPGWEQYEAAEGELVIEMDPGMAFGSGLHETTSMCIKALEECFAERGRLEAADEAADGRVRVLDVGCGTGILAIAAALLGADECLGIDIDPDAVRVAEENIAKNGLSGIIRAQYGDLTEGVDFSADIVVANLMADLVIRLTPAVERHLKKGGYYITSGILDIKEEICRQAIEDQGFRVVRVLSDGEWRAVVAVK